MGRVEPRGSERCRREAEGTRGRRVVVGGSARRSADALAAPSCSRPLLTDLPWLLLPLWAEAGPQPRPRRPLGQPTSPTSAPGLPVSLPLQPPCCPSCFLRVSLLTGIAFPSENGMAPPFASSRSFLECTPISHEGFPVYLKKKSHLFPHIEYGMDWKLPLTVPGPSLLFGHLVA